MSISSKCMQNLKTQKNINEQVLNNANSAKFNKLDSFKTFLRGIFPQKVEVVSTSSGGKTFL